jgi:hypothetical protein
MAHPLGDSERIGDSPQRADPARADVKNVFPVPPEDFHPGAERRAAAVPGPESPAQDLGRLLGCDVKSGDGDREHAASSLRFEIPGGLLVLTATGAAP